MRSSNTTGLAGTPVTPKPPEERRAEIGKERRHVKHDIARIEISIMKKQVRIAFLKAQRMELCVLDAELEQELVELCK
jgi:hypothetical protein